MFMHRVALAASLMSCGISPAYAQQKSPLLDMDANGEVQIAIDGHVSDYRLHSDLSPAVAALVDRNVRNWHFEPIMIDGKAVVAKTALHIRLSAEPVAGKAEYVVRVVDINFGEPRRSRDGMKPPRYPVEAAQARLGAKVLLSVRLDSEGKVVDVQPYQTSLDARASSENVAESWRKAFERVSIAAARHWRYDVSEMIGGKQVGTDALVPVIFSIGEPAKHEGEWKAFVPGPVHPAPWMDAVGGAAHHDVSKLADGQALSMSSRFQLKEDVIGKTL
jgi:hypothetical protein